MHKSLGGLLALTGLLGSAAAADIGPKSDVAAVRAAEHQKYPKDTDGGVHVSGDYALIQWYGNPEGSGPRAFKRSGSKWKLIYEDGGVTMISILVQHGIPAATARKLCTGWPKDATLCQAF